MICINQFPLASAQPASLNLIVRHRDNPPFDRHYLLGCPLWLYTGLDTNIADRDGPSYFKWRGGPWCGGTPDSNV